MVLVIGCGYVGERAADLLHSQGHEVAGVVHSAGSALRLSQAKPYTVVVCDVSDDAAVCQLASGFPAAPRTILHCASSNRGGAEMYRRVHLEGCANLQRHFPASRLLFTSSSSVYPQTDGSLVTEDSDASPDRETSRLLRETEDSVLARGGCVARLAGIYGPHRSFVLKNFLEGTATIEGNDGDGRCLNQIHRDDAARALMHLITGSHQGIYNVVDDAPMTQRECFTELSRRFHRPMPPVSKPDVNRKRAWTHKRVSNAKLRATGWSPQFPDYFNALDDDPVLVSSILAQVGAMHEP
jgi:nucleoside-diphosphate-sugar epimerase